MALKLSICYFLCHLSSSIRMHASLEAQAVHHFTELITSFKIPSTFIMHNTLKMLYFIIILLIYEFPVHGLKAFIFCSIELSY